MPKLVPMVHVPDVEATAAWYASIGFQIVNTASDGDEVNWALLRWGDVDIMLNSGGARSEAFRRDVDLYIHIDDVDGLFAALAGKVEVLEEPHDTFYGQREFIIRDFNRFWITFGQPA